MSKAELQFDKTYPKGDGAVKRLQESLKVNFETKTIDKSIKTLSEDFKKMSLREVLTSGAEGAVAKLLSVVWESALPKLVGRNMVQVMTGTGPSIRVPTATKAIAYQVGELGGAPIVPEIYSYVEIVARLWECIPVVSRSMVEDAMWDVVERQYAEAGRAIAEAETAEILAGLAADATLTHAATGNKLALLDFAKAIAAVGAVDRELTDVAITPDAYGDLLQDTAVTYAMYFGQAVAPTGKIPQILGINIWVSSKCAANTAVFVDRNHAAVLYMRRDVTIENYDDPVKDLVGAVATSRFRYAKIDANAIYKVTAT